MKDSALIVGSMPVSYFLTFIQQHQLNKHGSGTAYRWREQETQLTAAQSQLEHLKQQFAEITPTEGDKNSSSPKKDDAPKAENSDGSKVEGKPLRLKELAQEKLDGKTGNPSQLGDPISLKAETSDAEPPTSGKGPDGQRQGRDSKL